MGSRDDGEALPRRKLDLKTKSATEGGRGSIGVGIVDRGRRKEVVAASANSRGAVVMAIDETVEELKTRKKWWWRWHRSCR